LSFPSLSLSLSLCLSLCQIGKHGITISYKNYHATYLPEVCAEQRWTKIECIDSLLQKGGFRGTINDDVRKAIKLERYQSSKASMSYTEFIADGNQAFAV
jgi:AMME syndrome candidate gene 1 protein